MPRRVNNLFKIHKAKLVPSVRLGALVELHQRWVWLCARCGSRSDVPASLTLPVVMTKVPPVRKTEHTAEQKGEGEGGEYSKVRTIASFICFAVLNPGLFAILH